MRNSFGLLLSRDIFERIESEPMWKTPFFIVVAGTSLLTWLRSCWRGNSFVADFSVLGGAFVSMVIVLFVVWFVLALLLYFVFGTYLFPRKKLPIKACFLLSRFAGYLFNRRNAKFHSRAASDNKNGFLHFAESISDRP